MELLQIDRAQQSYRQKMGNDECRYIAPADDRFKTLLGADAWHRLPKRVKARFSKFLSPDSIVVYRGRVLTSKLNRAGQVLARLAWLIGSPLPLDNDATGPATVIVTLNRKTSAQNWTRAYPRRCGTLQTIASEKRFQGPTGLEEYVGYGVGMTLRVSENNQSLVFSSERFFFEAGPLRLWVPARLAPGQMTIIHRDRGAGLFEFELRLEHPVFGLMLHQLAEFCDDPHG